MPEQPTTTAPYGELILRRHYPIVVQAPERAVISLEALRQMHQAFFAGPDRIFVGDQGDGESPVYYRVTGWDAEHRGLIVELEAK